MTNRYQNYRFIYILSTLLTLSATFLLLQPIYDDIEELQDQYTTSSNYNITPKFIDELANVKLALKLETNLLVLALVLSSVAISLNSQLSLLLLSRISLLGKRCLESSSIIGSFGGLLASASLLLLTNVIHIRGHFLVWPLISFVFIGSVNVTALLLYRESHNFTKEPNKKRTLKFKFVEKFWLRKRFLLDCKEDAQMGAGISNLSIVSSKVNTFYPFDTKHDEVFRNIRRCSLAPLGDSFLLKQYELDHKKIHFKYVTKIVPLEKVSDKGLTNFGGRASFDNGNKSLTLEIPSFCSSTTTGWFEKSDLSWLHLKLIKTTIRGNASFVRFLVTLTLVGFVDSFNLYLIPWVYSRKQNNIHFLNLSAYTLVCRQIGQILLYHNSKKSLKIRVKHSTGFFIILATCLLRYAFYSIFAVYDQMLNLETLLAAEILQGFQTSWLNLVVFQLALEFARDSNGLLENLTSLSSIEERNEKTTEQVRFRFTITMICLLSCCLNGIATGVASLTCGLIIEIYGFTRLWFTCSTLTGIVGVLQYFMFRFETT